MTYSSPKRFNAQRAARRDLGNPDAQEGLDFVTEKNGAGEWTYRVNARSVEKPAAEAIVTEAPAVEPTEDETVAFLCSVLNRAHSEGGPVATAETLPYVRPAHLRKCVEDALASGDLSPAGKAAGEAWLARQPGAAKAGGTDIRFAEMTGADLRDPEKVRAQPSRKARAAKPEGETTEPRANKSAAVVAKAASPEGITNAEIKQITGWTKLGGFFGAVKRKGLVLRRVRENGDTRWFAEPAKSEAA